MTKSIIQNETNTAVLEPPAPSQAPSPVVRPPRVVVEMEPLTQGVAQVQKYGNLLLDLAGLGPDSAAGRQWLADAMDAANRFVISVKEQLGEVDLAPNTIFRAIKNGSGLGLSFNGVLGQLYLVPFKNGELSEANRKKQRNRDVYDCQLIVGYQGFEALAYGLGWLDTLAVEVVTQQEIDSGLFKFVRRETGPKLFHRYQFPRRVPLTVREGAREEIALAYASWRTTKGGHDVAIADKGRLAQAFKIKSPMWTHNYPAGAKKTAIRVAAKDWPKSRRMAGAILLDEQVELDQSQVDITGRRVPDLEDDRPTIKGPLPGEVGGLGDDHPDNSPAFRQLLASVENRQSAPAVVEKSIERAVVAGQIDMDQRDRLLDRLSEVAATPKPEESIPDDDVPF